MMMIAVLSLRCRFELFLLCLLLQIHAYNNPNNPYFQPVITIITQITLIPSIITTERQ
jgi:hypothetical protein